MSVTVINCETLAAGEYSPPWLDVVTHNGAVYGLTPTAVQRLGGPIEAAATPYLETGDMELVTGRTCNVGPVYVTLAADGELALRLTTEPAGRSRADDYRIPAEPSPSPRPRTVKTGGRAHGVTWRVRLGSRWPGVAWSVAGLTLATARARRQR
jgi:hypothetical protein